MGEAHTRTLCHRIHGGIAAFFCFAALAITRSDLCFCCSFNILGVSEPKLESLCTDSFSEWLVFLVFDNILASTCDLGRACLLIGHTGILLDVLGLLAAMGDAACSRTAFCYTFYLYAGLCRLVGRARVGARVVIHRLSVVAIGSKSVGKANILAIVGMDGCRRSFMRLDLF